MGKRKGVYIDQSSLKKVLKKIDKLEGGRKKFHDEVRKAAIDTRNEARSRFSGSAKAELERRGEYQSGMESSIKYRSIRRKDSENAYEVSSGSSQNKVMAYIEFGTRNRPINLRFVRDALGAEGSAYAARFKGGDNPNNFTHLNSKPYFFISVINQRKKLSDRLRKLVKKTIK